MDRKAIYAGSFECYTNSHHDVALKAAKLFDELHVVISTNGQQNRRFPVADMEQAIRESLALDGVTNCIVTSYEGVVADYCIEKGIGYFVRGLRNSIDYTYEESIACANKMIAPELETIYLRAAYSAVSATIVEEMFLYGKDCSQLVPEPVYRLLKRLEKA